MHYYVLTTPTGDEVVRLSNGGSSYFDAATGRWIWDPLLAVEVRMNGDWRQIEAYELPPAIVDLADEGRLGDRKSRGLHRGRHSRGDAASRLSPMNAEMPTDLLAHALAAKGFMPEDEGAFLHRIARERLPHGPALEIGTYCGKSAIYLGAAAREVGGTVLTIDHHRGSEENQAGWEHHDASLVDDEVGLMDTLPVFRRTVSRAGLEEHVTAVVGRSTSVAAWWRTSVSLLFIDGGHAEVHAQNDYSGFAHWIMAGGALVIHDVFERPEDGGQAPFHVWQRAVDSGSFEPRATVGSMRTLERTGGDAGEPVG